MKLLDEKDFTWRKSKNDWSVSGCVQWSKDGRLGSNRVFFIWSSRTKPQTLSCKIVQAIINYRFNSYYLTLNKHACGLRWVRVRRCNTWNMIQWVEISLYSVPALFRWWKVGKLGTCFRFFKYICTPRSKMKRSRQFSFLKKSWKFDDELIGTKLLRNKIFTLFRSMMIRVQIWHFWLYWSGTNRMSNNQKKFYFESLKLIENK